MKISNRLFCFYMFILFGAAQGCVQRSNNNSDSLDIVEENEQNDESNQFQIVKGFGLNDGDYDIGYIVNGTLFFYDIEKKSKKEFAEPNRVFHCAFDSKNNTLYYTVNKNDSLWLKKAIVKDSTIAINWVDNLNLSAQSCITETYLEKSSFLIKGDTLILEYHYEWLQGFTKLLGYNLNDDKPIDLKNFNLSTYQFEQDNRSSKIIDSLQALRIGGIKELYFVKSADTTKLTETQDLYLEIAETDPSYEKQFANFILSKDTSKLLYGVVTGYGDLQHGSYFLVNLDGTHQIKLNEDGLAKNMTPTWFGKNNLLYLKENESADVGDLFIAWSDNNEQIKVSDNVDFYFTME